MTNRECRWSLMLGFLATLMFALFIFGSEAYLAGLAIFGASHLGRSVYNYALRRWPQ